MQYVIAFITERYIASKLMFPVMTVTLTYLVVVIIVRDQSFSMLFLAYVLGLSIGSFASK